MVGEETVWASIEVVSDQWNRPAISLYGDVAGAVAQSLGPVVTHVSLSHDGAFATATVVIEYAE